MALSPHASTSGRRGPGTMAVGATNEAGSRADARRRPGTTGKIPDRRNANAFYVAGFFHRLAAAFVDLLVIVPVWLLLSWVITSFGGMASVAEYGGLSFATVRHRSLDIVLDLLLAGDPLLITALMVLVVVSVGYVALFQLTSSRTLGMRLLKIRIIDLYGDSPSAARVALRTLGYLASAATLGLGFLWIGFDSEKRGLHDWLAGTYVVKANPCLPD